MPFRQMIYLPRTEKPLLADEACTFHVMCRLYGTERSETITVYAGDGCISDAEEAAELFMAKLGFTVDVVAISENCGDGEWHICMDERCNCKNGCICLPV